MRFSLSPSSTARTSADGAATGPVRVDAWGPITARIPVPGLRHVVLGLVLGVLVMPLVVTAGYALVTGGGLAALPAAAEWMAGTGPGVLTGVASLWVGLLAAVAVAARRHPSGIKALVRWEFSRRDPLIAVGFVVAAFALNIAASFLLDLFGISTGQQMGNTGTFTAVEGWWRIGVVLAVAVGAPIVEEVFFRGLALHAALRHMRPWAAVVLTSVLFGLMHVQADPVAAIYTVTATTLVGAGLAVLRLRTGRLGTAVCAHVAFNSVNIALALLLAR